MPTKGGQADPDQSDATDISDAVFTFRFLFLGGDRPNRIESADSNDDGQIDISDGLKILRYLYMGEETPPAPGVPGFVCGPDTVPPGKPGSLGCESCAPCAP